MEKTDSSPLSRQALYADKKQWNQFLSVFLLAVGVGFTVAGIIFFFAYNWDELPKFAKLGIVEVLLIASVLLVTFTRWNKLVKQILLTGATFLIGTFSLSSDKSTKREPMLTIFFWDGLFSPFSGRLLPVSLRCG